MSEKPIRLGQKVAVSGKDTSGTVAYIGTTHFSSGKWYGVILEDKYGKNNGTVQGKSYFQCEDNYGIFVRQSQLIVCDGEDDDASSDTTKSSAPSTGTTPTAEKPKSRLPTYGKLSLSHGLGSLSSPQFPAYGEPFTSSPFTSMQNPSLTKTPSQSSLHSSKTDISKGLTSSKTNLSTPLSNTNKPKPISLRAGNGVSTPTSWSSSFRKPLNPTNFKFGSTKKSDPQPKLPLGSVGKLTSPQSTKEERTPTHESPHDMKKAPSFIETGFVENITPQYTPGAPSAAMQTLEDKANAMHAHQEIENLKAEIKDLNEKLETIRVKRAQDKDKLKEGEKLRLQVEQLIEFKSRIMESQASLQKELQKAKQDAKDAIEAKERYVEETEELMENVEMLTLDKEMAEEKAETIQLEMDQMKMKIEELMLDLELLRAEEADEIEHVEGRVSSVQVKQLEQQVARLHETLVRMRDIAAHDKHELQKLQKDMDAKKSEVLELTRSKENYANQVAELEATIADLQEQVDAALGAEEMVETLTDRNLNLEERVMELLETVADLEAINDMNDQLQENTRDLELELREELDMANAKIREVQKEREASNEVIVDQNTTINKFRDLVQKMQEQNLDLRHSLEKETNKPVGTPSEIIDFKKMFTETKAHSKAIDLELRRLEVQQANQHVRYLTQYLPDTFMNRGGDHDAVLVLLLLPRLVWKAEIIIGGLRDQYNPPEIIDRNTVLKSHSVDQYSFSSRMLQMLYMMQAILKQYNYVVNTCSVEVFLKMGTMYPEMAVHERNLDFYIDLLRKDQLDENVHTDFLEKTINYFQTIYPSHLMEEKLDQPTFMSDVAKVINSAAETLRTESARLEALMPPTEDNGEITELLKLIKNSSEEIGSCVKRVKRRMPQDGSSGPVTYPEEVQEMLSSSMADMYNVTRALRHIVKNCMQQTALIGDIENGIPSDKIKELIHQSTDLVYGSEDQGPESIRLSMSKTLEELSKITNTLEKGEFDFDGTQEKEAIPPMSLRAEAIKSELKDTEHLKYKLESKEQDLKDLKLTLKQKNEELSQMTVRRDMSEKKLSTATRDADITIEKLQRKLDDTMMMLRRKEKEFDETMDHLQSDIESLEFEKGELREKLKTLNKKTLFEALTRSTPLGGGGSPSSPTTPSSGVSLGGVTPSSSNGMMVRDSPLLLQQIADLKLALNHASENKYSAISSDMHRKLSSLRPLKITSCRLASDYGDEKRDLDKEERAGEMAAKESSQRLKELTKLTSRLRKELREVMTGVEVVDLTKRHPGTTPATQSRMPIHHLVAHKDKIIGLQNRISLLEDEITRLVASKKPGGDVKTSFSTFPTPQLLKAIAEKDVIKIGKITIPGSSKNSEVVSMILQPEHLKTLHLRLLNLKN